MAYAGIGLNNGAGADDRLLFEKKMSTDVLKYFQSTNIMKPLVTNKSITAGKSEAFPVVGNATAAEINNDAAELAIQNLKSTEREIVIGKMTVAHSWITDLDNAMVHYDSKSAQVESIGRSLAKLVDEKILLKVIEAGRIVDAAAATAAGLLAFDDDIFTASKTILLADITTGSKVYTAMVDAVTEYVDKDVVGEPVFVLRPSSYFALLNNAANTGLTWVADEYAQSGKVPMVMGKRVMTSPHFPAHTGVGGIPAVGDCQGVLFSKESVGVLELLSVSIRTDYVPTRVSHLITGKMAVGYGVLNHSCAIAIDIA